MVAARTSGAGGEVIRRMRGRPSRLEIPVLFVTAPGAEEGELSRRLSALVRKETCA